MNNSNLNNSQLVKLEIFVPTTHLEQITAALQASGAGSSERYDSVLSYSAVTGRWRPLPGANPYNGEIGKICEAAEYKIEVNCPLVNLAQIIAAVKAAHPYEEPLINVLALLKV